MAIPGASPGQPWIGENLPTDDGRLFPTPEGKPGDTVIERDRRRDRGQKLRSANCEVREHQRKDSSHLDPPVVFTHERGEFSEKEACALGYGGESWLVTRIVQWLWRRIRPSEAAGSGPRPWAVKYSASRAPSHWNARPSRRVSVGEDRNEGARRARGRDRSEGGREARGPDTLAHVSPKVRGVPAGLSGEVGKTTTSPAAVVVSSSCERRNLKLPRKKSPARRNSIGPAVRRLRRGMDPKLTLEELSGRLQIEGVTLDRAALSRIENQQRSVFDFEAEGLARALRVPLGVLFGQDPE